MLLLRPPGVYRTGRDTDLLIDTVRSTGAVRDRHVLDVGTGTGAIALAAARSGAASVTAVDLSLRSAVTTRLNARLHGADVTVRRGDLFSPVRGQRFDVVLANPPYVPAEREQPARHRIARSWDGGVDGRLVLDRILAGLPQVLAQDGTALIVYSAVCGVAPTMDRLDDVGMAGSVVARATLPWGPVMRSRAALLRARGLVAPDEQEEEIVEVACRWAEQGTGADEVGEVDGVGELPAPTVLPRALPVGPPDGPPVWKRDGGTDEVAAAAVENRRGA